MTVLRRVPEQMTGDVEAECHAESHTVYSGEEDTTVENADTPQVCCEACRNSMDCRYWVWGMVQKQCWLRKTKEYSTEQRGFVSGRVEKKDEL